MVNIHTPCKFGLRLLGASKLCGTFIAMCRLAVHANGFEFFETNIRPVLGERCYQCHSTDSESGQPANLTTRNSQRSVQTNHWAFLRPTPTPVPRVQHGSQVRTPIDAFVLAKLEPKQLQLAPEADRATLARRAHLDLTGLPPSPEATASFLADAQPGAYDRLIDRLLASPHFGERWARHWLDWAGYVDVLGGDNDAATIKLGDGKWQYRDYVIRAFNQDKPYDRFLHEQLAGDELVDWRSAPTFTPEVKDLLIATGFLRVAADDTDEDELNTADIRHGVLQRTVEIVANNLLALTLQCAKCHDHKYDPITQRDYYRFEAQFSPAFNPQAWLQPKQRALPDVSRAERAEIEKHNGALEARANELKKCQSELLVPFHERVLAAKLAALPEAIRADTKAALQTVADQRNEIQKYLAAKFEKELAVKTEEIVAVLGDEAKAVNVGLERQIAELNSGRKSWGTIQAVYDVGPPPPTHRLLRGNHQTPGEEVEPGVLSPLAGAEGSAPPACRPRGETSGRRLALARWFTEPNTPAAGLVSRVLVNRVWQQLFGKGIVETSDNFGLAGARPTHPELLDWLATEFVRQQWQLKPLIKLILTSSVYRQSAAGGDGGWNAAADQKDPADQLLWRQRLRRLESEAVRDSLLAVSGTLERTMGGAPVPLENRPDGLVVVKEQGPPAAANPRRRSVYVLARRNYHLSLLNVFDQPTVATSCACRSPSTVVLQSLTMLNDAFVLEQANAFAQRIIRTAGDQGKGQQIALAFQIAFARPPSPREIGWSEELLRRQAERYRSANAPPVQADQKALAHLCHTLLNTSEFLYIP